jgi:hypothetical protein
LLVTLVTTTAVGAQMAYNFENDLPGLNGGDFTVVFQSLRHPARLVYGLPSR